ncbi:YopX family protein [Virgibacillus siamensis]|uniref:YopX family protein n=2 Tax=Bacillati TaxID=1783272 RepID=UPI00363E04B8
MRDYKFRAWCKKRKRMYEVLHLHTTTWSNGGVWATGKGYDVIEQKDINIDIQPKDAVIMQYTGLKDENEADICEGDLFKHGISVGEIKYQGCGFYIDWHAPVEWGKSNRLDILHDEGEIIGNIHQSHLLNLPGEVDHE